MNDRETVELLVTQRFQSERDNPHLWVEAILAYGEQVRREQREVDAQIVESFAADIHMEATDSAEIAAAIRANDQVTKPKGEVERSRLRGEEEK